ncbi:hypothetical protein DFA_10130 [Cavenderia fasciculata]|uniref:Uncharacterized protein n=1 Tax=Cavenderia fasciculata TaxID=261658 RepID=F4Q9C7_CACFS|nr:uncharacterized protein DFA_10130 [Cavenderia fasciculata]EGG15296.1 hypothetical protein DFA_10130 [Cavenderia fasciculata]|eukprot:XP_004352016.1 hypothetical protein DFA_10130 [Cavenderia fasciculata]
MNDKRSESSLQFKSIINSYYLRTKIFNHVNHIHQAIVDRYFIGREYQKECILIVKIPQVISLQEFIRINRTDLFIDHFDRVYDTIKHCCKDDNGVVKLDNDIVFKDLLDVIFQNNDSVALDFMLNRFKFQQTIRRSIDPRRPVSIEVYKVLKRYNYINVTDNDINHADSLRYIKSLLCCMIDSGDISMFDQFCTDCLNTIPTLGSKNIISVYSGIRAYDDVFIDIINKLNNNNMSHNNNNNNNNNRIDLRESLFVGALRCSNNQEILKWIKDSFDRFDMFVDFYHQSNRWIERFASMDTLKLIDYREPTKYTSSNCLSTGASSVGNLDYLRYMVTQNHQYIFQEPHLSRSLEKGHLECTNFIIDAISQYANPDQFTPCGSINPTIVSLDLVQRLLVNHPHIAINPMLLIGSSISQPIVLEYLLSHGSYSFNNIEPSLLLQDPKSTQLLLNQPRLDQPTKFRVSATQIPMVQKRPLELLYLQGHSLVIVDEERPLSWDGNPVDLDVLQLIIKHQSIESIPPWVIMTRYGQYDDHIELLKDALELNKNNPYIMGMPLSMVFTDACKNGLIKVVECFGLRFIWVFGSRGFGIALENNQIQVAKYLGQELARFFSPVIDTQESMWSVMLDALNRVEDDQVFEYFWSLFKPLTTNSEIVSRTIGQNRSNNRHLTTNRVDRMIKHYGQYYNGCERDEYQMKPLTLSNEYKTVVINHIITKYQNDVSVNQFIDIKSFDYSRYYNHNLTLYLFYDKVPKLEITPEEVDKFGTVKDISMGKNHFCRFALDTSTFPVEGKKKELHNNRFKEFGCFESRWRNGSRKHMKAFHLCSHVINEEIKVFGI